MEGRNRPTSKSKNASTVFPDGHLISVSNNRINVNGEDREWDRARDIRIEKTEVIVRDHRIPEEITQLGRHFERDLFQPKISLEDSTLIKGYVL